MTKPTKEMLKEYAAIAKKSNRDMKGCIKAHLVANCPKFAGHEDKFDECIEYVTECAREILNGKNGEVADVSTTVSRNMRRVPQNEAPAHGFSGGRTAQGTMSRSPEAAAQSGKASALDGLPDKDGQSAKTMDTSASCRYAPQSCSPEDCNPAETAPSHGGSVASLEALESQARQSQRRALANAQKCGRTSQSHSANARPRASFRNKEEFIQWAIDEGLDPVDANECWESTEERGGKDADGNTVKNMKAFARKWCRTRANNRRTS